MLEFGVLLRYNGPQIKRNAAVNRDNSGGIEQPVRRPFMPDRTPENGYPQSYVYFLKDEKAGLIKIGSSISVDERIKALNSKFKTSFTLKGFILGHLSKEKEISEQFKHLHQGREMYLPGEDLLDFIERHTIHEMPPAPHSGKVPRKKVKKQYLRGFPGYQEFVEFLGISPDDLPYIITVSYDQKGDDDANR